LCRYVADPASIGKPSNTNDANFFIAVVMSTSFLALVVGVVLPGDWGAFGSYLIGGSSLAGRVGTFHHVITVRQNTVQLMTATVRCPCNQSDTPWE
jgi:hypothetical protein